MQINELFPTVIGYSENKNHNTSFTNYLLKIKKQISKGGKNWEANLYNTEGTYQLHTDPNFKDLTYWIFNEVYNYKNIIGYNNYNMKCTASWFNVYEKYDYQEKHNHIGGNTLSAIYYYKVPKDSSDLIFHSNEPESVEICFDKNNKYTWRNFVQKPKEGLLIMFKSHVVHSVLQKDTSQKRISFAYNFTLKNESH